jgi:hypothetical protein
MKCEKCNAVLEDYPVTIFGVNGGPDIHAYAYECPNGCKEPIDVCDMCGEQRYYTKDQIGEFEMDVVHCPKGCVHPLSKIDHWCYQILKHTDAKYNCVWYGLHEVYKDKDGNMLTYAEDPEVVGDTVQEILRVLNSMRHDARTKPVISVTDEEPTAEQNGEKVL